VYSSDGGDGTSTRSSGDERSDGGDGTSTRSSGDERSDGGDGTSTRSSGHYGGCLNVQMRCWLE
jgi:hypothetical protein